MVNTLHKGRIMMIMLMIVIIISRDSAVGRATFHLSKMSRPAMGSTQLRIQGYRRSFPGGWDVDTMKTGRCLPNLGRYVSVSGYHKRLFLESSYPLTQHSFHSKGSIS